MEDIVSQIYGILAADAKGRKMRLSEDEFRQRLQSDEAFRRAVWKTVDGRVPVKGYDEFSSSLKKKSAAQARQDFREQSQSGGGKSTGQSEENLAKPNYEAPKPPKNQPEELDQGAFQAAIEETYKDKSPIAQYRDWAQTTAIAEEREKADEEEAAKLRAKEFETAIKTGSTMRLSHPVKRGYTEAIQSERNLAYLPEADRDQALHDRNQIALIEEQLANPSLSEIDKGRMNAQLAIAKAEFQKLNKQAQLSNTDEYFAFYDTSTWEAVPVHMSAKGFAPYREEIIKELAMGVGSPEMAAEFAGKTYEELSEDQKRVVDFKFAERFVDKKSMAQYLSEAGYSLDPSALGNSLRSVPKGVLETVSSMIKASGSKSADTDVMANLYSMARNGMITKTEFERRYAELVNELTSKEKLEQGFSSELQGQVPVDKQSVQTPAIFGVSKGSRDTYFYTEDQVRRWLSKMPSFDNIAAGAENPYVVTDKTRGEVIGSEIDKIAGRIKTNPIYDQKYASKLGKGLGSSFAFLLTGLATRGAGVATWIGSAVAGGLAQQQSAYEDAIRSGATPDEAISAFATAGPVGWSEGVPVERLLNRMKGLVGMELLNKMILSGTEEAIQETFQSVSTDALAKWIYEETRVIGEHAGDDAAVGFGSGLIMAGMTNLLSRTDATPEQREQVQRTKTILEDLIERKANERAAKTEMPGSDTPGTDAGTGEGGEEATGDDQGAGEAGRPISEFNGKTVRYKGKKGILKVDEGKVTVETANSIYEIPGTADQLSSELGIKDYQDISVTDNNTATVDGVEYDIVTNDAGSVIKLEPRGEGKAILDSATLVDVEIKRNQTVDNPVVQQSIESEPEQVKSAAIEQSPVVMNALNLALTENMNETVDSAIDRLYDGEELSDQEALQVEMYTMDAIERLEALKERIDDKDGAIDRAINGIYAIDDLLNKRDSNAESKSKPTVQPKPAESKEEKPVGKSPDVQQSDTGAETGGAEATDQAEGGVKVTPVKKDGKVIIDENGDLTTELSDQFEKLKAENNKDGINELYSTINIFLNGVAQSKGERAVAQLESLKNDIENYSQEQLQKQPLPKTEPETAELKALEQQTTTNEETTETQDKTETEEITPEQIIAEKTGFTYLSGGAKTLPKKGHGRGGADVRAMNRVFNGGQNYEVIGKLWEDESKIPQITRYRDKKTGEEFVAVSSKDYTRQMAEKGIKIPTSGRDGVVFAEVPAKYFTPAVEKALLKEVDAIARELFLGEVSLDKTEEVEAKKADFGQAEAGTPKYPQETPRYKEENDNRKAAEDWAEKQGIDLEQYNEYGLHPVQEYEPTFRGTTVSEWESIQNGGASGEFFTPSKDVAEKSGNWKDAEVVIELKPEAKTKLQEGEKKFDSVEYYVKRGKGNKITLDDVAKVYDKEGNVIYDATNPPATQEVERDTNPALESVEATAKALEGKDIARVISPNKINELNKQLYANLLAKQRDLVGQGERDFENNPEVQSIKYQIGISEALLKNDNKAIAEAYHKAKADGSNPELVKAVENLLGQAEAKPETQTKPVESKPGLESFTKSDFKPTTRITKEQLKVEDKGNALSALNRGWKKFAGAMVSGSNVVIKFSDRSKTERTIVAKSNQQAEQIAENVRQWVQYKQKVSANKSAAAKKRGFSVPKYVEEFEPTNEYWVAAHFIASGGRLRTKDIVHYSGVQAKELNLSVLNNSAEPIDIIAERLSRDSGLDENTLVGELAQAAARGRKAAQEEIRVEMESAGLTEVQPAEIDDALVDMDEIEDDAHLEAIYEMLEPIRDAMGEDAWKEWMNHIDSFKDENGAIDYEKAIDEADDKYKGFIKLLKLADEKATEQFGESRDDSPSVTIGENEARVVEAIEEAKAELETAKKQLRAKQDELSAKPDLFGGEIETKGELFTQGTDTSTENIEAILKPYKERVASLEQEIDELEKEREAARNLDQNQESMELPEEPPFSRSSSKSGWRGSKKKTLNARLLDHLRGAFPNVTVNVSPREKFMNALKRAGRGVMKMATGFGTSERKRIEEEAKANGTWLKAPNGKPTNLTPAQWVTVRTRAFKDWFGDWEVKGIELTKDTDAILDFQWELQKLLVPDSNSIDGYHITETEGRKTVLRIKDHAPSWGNFLYDIEDKGLSRVVNISLGSDTNKNKTTSSYSPTDLIQDAKEEGIDLDVIDIHIPFGATLQEAVDIVRGKVAFPSAASKVVDENGEPMVVYHGTDKDFDVFKANKKGLIFVSDNPVIASKYASNDYGSRTTETAGRIVSLFVKAENIFDPELFSENSEFIEALAERGDFSEVQKSRFDDFNDLAKQALYDGNWSVLETKGFIDFLKEKGFDGIFIDNRPDYLQLDGVSTKNRDIAIFSPNQIKSATANSGAFSSESDNIMEEPKKEYGNKVKTGQYTLEFDSENNFGENVDEVYMERLLSEKKGIDLTGPTQIKSSKDIAWLFRHLEDAASENAFVVLHLPNGGHEVVYLTTGGPSATVVPLQYIVASANELGATAITMVHNHPSGTLRPSNVDIQLHRNMKEVMNNIGVTTNSSVIINLDSGQYVDFDESNYTVEDKGAEPELSTEVKVKAFERQKLYQPITTQITSSLHIAEFVSKQKRGTNKVSVITMDRANKITRYTLLDGSMPEKDLIAFMLTSAAKHGDRVAIATDIPLSKSAVNRINEAMQSADLRLLDVLTIKNDQDIINNYESFVDQGKISEPQENYGESQVNEQTAAFQEDVINGFYSPLRQIISNAKQDKMPATQWLKKFANTEEAKWTGLRGWLESQDGSLTKQELLDFMDNNRIEIEVVEKGEGMDMEERMRVEKSIHDKVFNKYAKDRSYVVENNGKYEYWNVEISKKRPDEVFSSYEEAAKVKKADDDLRTEKNSPLKYIPEDLMAKYEQEVQREKNRISNYTVAKYAKHQLEGEKENYKEVLVTLPVRFQEVTYSVVKGDAENPYKVKNNVTGDVMLGGFRTKERAEEYAKSMSTTRYDTKSNFKSSHWDEPNIVVHLRMNTRTDADGNKVLFLEEIQSDWGQKGRKEGFQGEDKMPLVDINGNTVVDDTRSYDKKVPSAPFVTDTNSWVKLGLKVAMQEAVKQGVDKIAWTTGEQQNDRYDLSKSVSKIEINKKGDNYEVKAYDKGDLVQVAPIQEQVVSEKELEGVVGKEIANKAINEGQTNFEGSDLKVGGKGMKGFYGSPSENSLGIVGGVASKLFGQDLGTVKITTRENLSSQDSIYEAYNSNGVLIKRGNSESYIKSIAEQNNGTYKLVDAKQTSTQHSVDVTPSVRSEVARGLPLFNATTAETYGFFDPTTGEIHLNEDVFDQLTTLEEFGHLWNAILKANKPEVWAAGIKLAKKHPMWENIRQDPAYEHIWNDDSAIANEVLAKLTAGYGVDEFISEEQKSAFRKWLRQVWQAVKEFLYKAGIITDVSKLGGINLTTLTSIQELAQIAAKDMIKYGPITNATSETIAALERGQGVVALSPALKERIQTGKKLSGWIRRNFKNHKGAGRAMFNDLKSFRNESNAKLVKAKFAVHEMKRAIDSATKGMTKEAKLAEVTSLTQNINAYLYGEITETDLDPRIAKPVKELRSEINDLTNILAKARVSYRDGLIYGINEQLELYLENNYAKEQEIEELLSREKKSLEISLNAIANLEGNALEAKAQELLDAIEEMKPEIASIIADKLDWEIRMQEIHNARNRTDAWRRYLESLREILQIGGASIDMSNFEADPDVKESVKEKLKPIRERMKSAREALDALREDKDLTDEEVVLLQEIAEIQEVLSESSRPASPVELNRWVQGLAKRLSNMRTQRAKAERMALTPSEVEYRVHEGEGTITLTVVHQNGSKSYFNEVPEQEVATLFGEPIANRMILANEGVIPIKDPKILMNNRLYAKMMYNQGKYVHRSYEMFEVNDWKDNVIKYIGRDAYDDAWNFIAKEMSEKRVKFVEIKKHPQGFKVTYTNRFGVEYSPRTIYTSLDALASAQGGPLSVEDVRVIKAKMKSRVSYKHKLPKISERTPGLEFVATSSKIKNTIDDILTPDKALKVLKGVTEAGAIFKTKKDIPVEIRRLMGEITDPKINTTKTITLMAKALEQSKIVNEMMDNATWAKESTGDKDVPAGLPVRIDHTKMPMLGDRVYYITQEAYDLLFPRTDAFLDAMYSTWLTMQLLKVSFYAKSALTKLNPESVARNFISSGMYIAMSANFNPAKVRLAAAIAFKDFGKADIAYSYLSAWGIAMRAINWKRAGRHQTASDQQLRDLYERATRAGIMDTELVVSSLRDMRNEIQQRRSEGRRSALREKWELFDDATSKNYQFGDQVMKIAAWLNEMEHLKKIYPEKSQEEIDLIAGKMIADMTPTYEDAPDALKSLSKNPLVAPFILWPYAILKSQYNVFMQSIYEIFNKEGNKEMSARGRKRLASWMFMAMVTPALRQLFMSLTGRDDDDDDALNTVSADWAKNNLRLYTNSDKKAPEYFDLTYIDPFASIHNPLNAALNSLEEGRSPIKAASQAGKEVFGPVFSQDIFWSAVSRAAQGKNEYGYELWGDADRLPERIFKSVGYTAEEALTPGVLRVGTNMAKAVIPELQTETDKLKTTPLTPSGQMLNLFFGVKQRSTNIEAGAKSRFKQFHRGIQDQNTQYKYSGKNYNRENEDARLQYEEIMKVDQALSQLGFTEQERNRMMKDAGMSRYFILLYVRGGTYYGENGTKMVKPGWHGLQKDGSGIKYNGYRKVTKKQEEQLFGKQK